MRINTPCTLANLYMFTTRITNNTSYSIVRVYRLFIYTNFMVKKKRSPRKLSKEKKELIEEVKKADCVVLLTNNICAKQGDLTLDIATKLCQGVYLSMVESEGLATIFACAVRVYEEHQKKELNKKKSKK